MFLQKVILACVLCSTIRALAIPPKQVNADAAADEPGLLNMLDFFKGKSTVGELTTFLKQYKSFVSLAKGYMDICKPCKEVYADAGKSNAAAGILFKMTQGHAPDIKDMYDLATKGIGDITASLRAARMKNKKYMKMKSVLSKGSAIYSSVPLLEELLSDVTGHQFTLDPALVKKVHDGSVIVSKSNVAQVNLLLLVSLWAENEDLWFQIGSGLKSPPFDFIKPMEMLNSFNASSLAKMKEINENGNDNKYTVSVTDPGAVKVLKDLQNMNRLVKTKSQDNSKAESLFLETFTDVIGLSMRILKNAENPRKVNLSPV